MDLNLNEVDYIKIYKKSLKFEFHAKEDRWNELLVPGKKTYKFKEKDVWVLEAIKKFSLKDFDKINIIKRASDDIYGKVRVGDIFECDFDMCNYLTGDNKKNNIVAKILNLEE